MSAEDRPIMDWKNAIALTIYFFATYFFFVLLENNVRGAVFPFVVSMAAVIWLGRPIWPILKQLLVDYISRFVKK